LYSQSYIETHHDENEIPDVEQPSRFVLLAKYLKGSLHTPEEYFLDYGCGASPETLAIARSNNLTPIGMEFAPDVRKLASSSSGEIVLSREELLDLKVKFSVIFLGDVLEHLVAPQIVLKELSELLAEDGVIISQGPLQGARTLTHAIVGAYSCITPKRFATYPPYHVTLAHSQSMVKLFSAAKLQIEHISIEEVSWPAPTLNELCSKFTLRNLFLFLVKVPDMFLSRVLPMYGTRYFMVGKVDESRPSMSLK
jgi:2-polyprenyl-3-methyl-5-hydroxy-6-metoxy-1,4-benzoquinol methylase